MADPKEDKNDKVLEEDSRWDLDPTKMDEDPEDDLDDEDEWESE